MARKAQDMDYTRLTRAMSLSRLAMEKMRRSVFDAVRDYAGWNYADEGAKRAVPVNLLALYVSVVGRNLIAKNPRVMYSTYNREARPTVKAMQRWANERIQRMYFAETMKRTVVDALFSVGINKVSLMTPAESSVYGYEGRAGEPRVTKVHLDDFVYDIHARDFREAGYMGHRVRVPLERIKEDKNYTKARKDLSASEDKGYNEQGDQRVSTISRGWYGQNTEEFEDFVDLWEIWIPSRKMIVTFSGDDLAHYGDATNRVLREQSWIGPDCGPYHLLGYGVVPGNAMPKAPIQDLFDLHLAINSMYRKLINQAGRLKELLLCSGSGNEDANRIINASDGEGVGVDNPTDCKTVLFGGPAQNLQQFVLGLQNLFSWLAGNLDIMGGLAPQAKTATQDTMLNQNSARAIADMQDSTISHVASVLEGLGWYWWHDPTLHARSQYVVDGLPEYSAPQTISPERRQQFSWNDIELRVDPHSMAHSTPQSRLANIMGLVQNVVMPMMPLLKERGIQFDVQVFLQRVGELSDEPTLDEIIRYGEPIAVETKDEAAGGGGNLAGGGAQTRTYERVSRPGMSENANRQVMQQILAGGNPQPAQRNGMGPQMAEMAG